MSTRILVVDDQADKRQSDYKIIQRMECAGKPIELIFPYSPQEFTHLLSTQQFDAFIVDVILSQNGWNLSMANVFDSIDRKGPVFLVSSLWDETAMEEARGFIHRENVKGLFSWHEFTKEDKTPVWFQLDSAIRKWKNLDTNLRLGHNDKITILHLSDLQFGTDHTPHSKLEWQEVKVKIEHEWPGGPTFIAITGDITEHGLPNEFKQAEEWIKNLVKDWKGWELPNKRLLLVPGNHDALLPLSVADHLEYDRTTKEIHWKASPPVPPSMTSFAFTPFLQFVHTMSGENDWIRPLSQYWIREQFKHLGVVFFGCNTASEFAHKGGVENGKIPTNDFASISQMLRNIAKESAESDLIVVGLGHHPPFDASITKEDTRNGYTKLCTMSTPIHSDGSCQGRYAHVPRILLHGHIHRREFSIPQTSDSSTVVIAASTPTLSDGSRSPDTARGLNMIELLRTDGIVQEMKCWACEWDRMSLEKRRETSFLRNNNGSFVYP